MCCVFLRVLCALCERPVLRFCHYHKKKPGLNIWFRYFGDPAVSVRPLGFPSHPCGWFSIIVYPLLFNFVDTIMHFVATACDMSHSLCIFDAKRTFLIINQWIHLLPFALFVPICLGVISKTNYLELHEINDLEKSDWQGRVLNVCK